MCSETNLTQDEENVVGCLFSSMGQDANDTGLLDGLQILKTVTESNENINILLNAL